MTTSYQLKGLTRRFPGVLAVDHVDLTVERGEIHGIIGRNGAGKSVLVSMIAGLLPPTDGSIEVGGGHMDARQSTPSLAHRLGVSLVPQEPKFAPELSVTDNLFMGCTLTGPLNFIRRADMTGKVEEVVQSLELDVSPTRLMRDLPIETQQLLAFGKAHYIDNAQTILLDEITASLTRERKQMLLTLLRQLARSKPDISFTLISHHISEIMEFADRVTVMRDGKAVATLKVAETDERALADWIVGDAQVDRLENMSGHAPDESAAPVLHVEALASGTAFRDLSFSLRKGEVVGIAGLEGSGKDAAIESLFGMRDATARRFELDGEPVALAAPGQAINLGVALLPKHREAQAILQNRSVEDNTLIASLGRFMLGLGFLDLRAGRVAARTKVEALAVKTPSLQTQIDHLSGGNKQKVLIARLSLTAPKLMLLNEPTRGVDIATKPDLLRIVRTQLSENAGIIVLSESEDELIAICDRILVFFRGQVVRVLQRGQADFKVSEVYKSIQGVQAA